MLEWCGDQALITALKLTQQAPPLAPAYRAQQKTSVGQTLIRALGLIFLSDYWSQAEIREADASQYPLIIILLVPCCA